MRCALVSTEIGGFHHGGIGTYVRQAAKALTAAGHEVWLVTQHPEPARIDELRTLPEFAQVRFVEEVAAAAPRLRFAQAHPTLDFAQRAYDALRAAAVPFDYLEFPDYGAAGAVAVAEQRLFGSLDPALVVVALHSPTFECWQHNRALHVYGPHEREVAALEHETIRHAPRLWSPSARLRELVAERLGLDPAAIPLVRYPLQLPATAPPPPAPRTRLADLDFVFCGRIEPRKGVRELAAAFAQLPELRLDCIGRDGPTAPLQTSEVEALRRHGPPNVRYLPPLPRDQLLARLRTADVVLLPSPWDNWPNACLEAMAEARVVVGGRNSGMAEMIEPGRSGFLVDGGSADDLVRVLRHELAPALDRLPAIGAAAAERSRSLADPRHYVTAIEQLVETHRRSPRRPASPKPPPRVSVLVPYHREDEAMVGAAVRSAAAQSHRDLEILVVDDGSPRPDAAAILAALARIDPRVRILRKPNGGLASARNHAIEHATGECCFCLDADNLLRPDALATALQALAAAPEALAVAGRLQAFDDRNGTPMVLAEPLPFDRPLALFRNSLGDAGALFRASVFRDHGLRYDPVVDCYSDWALWLDFLRLGLPRVVVPRVLYDYRVRPDSMMAATAFDRHLALLGLLVERHWPTADGPAERELLTTLIQGWGVGALVAALGHPSDLWQDARGLARRLQDPDRRAMRVRDQLAFVLGRFADRHPALGRVGRWLVGSALRWHGRRKDRRTT